MLTVGYLLEQIELIRAESAAGPHQLTVDVQRPTGSFSIDFLGGFTSFYDRITNVAVRLEPKAGAQHLMLANCHFDTVANSPGTRVSRRLRGPLTKPNAGSHPAANRCGKDFSKHVQTTVGSWCSS